MQICYDQPQMVPQPRADPVLGRPTTSHSMGNHVSQWVANGRDFATRASSRASIHTITRPRRSQSKPRPSIGRPTDFRHYDGGYDGIQSMMDDAPMPIRRRRSFRPLELSIYMPEGRLSPLPNFATLEWDNLSELEVPAQALVRNRDSRTNSTSSDPSTASYLVQRKPIGAGPGSRRSSVQSQTSLRSRPISAALSTLPFLHEHEETKSRPESFISIPPSLGRASTHSSLTSPKRILSRLPSPARSRANTAPSPRPGSLRRAKTDVDEAIRELNTIVEERRASAYRSNNQSPAFINRPPPSPSHHVPAIAPSLRMHVRSETLSDIGSAFSVPVANKPLPTPPTSTPLSRVPTKLSLSPPTRTLTGPLNSNPITLPTPTIPTPTTPIGRLGAWLKRSIPSTPASQTFRSAPTTPKSTASTPFYQCEPPIPTPSSRAHSRPSTAGSRTLHTRQDSNDTATVTLFSSTTADSMPTTPALSTRSLSPDPIVSPATPARVNLLKGEGKTRRVPKPLDLAKEKEMMIEASLGSARSINSQRSLKPPPSPNYGLLRGMEIAVGAEGMPPVSPVGVAF